MAVLVRYVQTAGFLNSYVTAITPVGRGQILRPDLARYQAKARLLLQCVHLNLESIFFFFLSLNVKGILTNE